MPLFRSHIQALLSLLIPSLPLGAAVDFQKDIQPLLEDNCFDCHGPDKQKSALRFDQRVSLLKGGDSGLPTIVPGSPEKSYLLEVLQSNDPDIRMPPKGGPLDPEEIALLNTWIKEGAEWPGQMDQKVEHTTDHWSFQPIVRPDRPDPKGHPVDAFLNLALRKARITANPEAEPATLIRRASVVLTGLRPTAGEIRAFEQASRTDADQAYLDLIDRLLDSPHFGERWAQHWLDVIRWAETNGSEANLYRKGAWTFRDYVVRSFNEDLPYDRFLTEQLAGDQLGVGEATGFLVAGPHVPAATVGREPSAIRQARADRMDEILQTVGASFMGVTISCARCHNHKFDPVTIQDYYSLNAVFQGVEFGGRYPELSDQHPRRKRAQELYPQINAQRNILREGARAWEENSGGFTDLVFPRAKTAALRIEFDWPNVNLDELEVFGPAKHRHNLALATHGATLREDPTMADERHPLSRANDGEYGTMTWKARAAKGESTKPWIEIHFAKAAEVNRFRFSINREYYFETDYLSQMPKGRFPGFRVLAQQHDGSWKPLATTKQARQALTKDPQLQAASTELHSLLKTLAEEGPRHSFIGKFSQPRPTHVLHRGSPENPRDEVPPAGLAILDGDLGLDGTTPDAPRRLAFARWLTKPDHPLTARVAVNRLWHHVFGAGIVATGADFGLAGAPPHHPELLDWLAAEFIHPSDPDATAWSQKAMIRLLATSDAFKRSSTPESTALDADANAIRLWRYPPRRMEAEVIRDSILQASGKLDRNLGGRSFRIHNVKKTYSQWEVVDNHGPETWRRMLYQERMRRVDDRIFTAFDFPDCGQVRAKRPVSTTPLQALNLLNSPFVVEQAELIAERAQQEAGDSPETSVRRVFALILGRGPDDSELQTCLEVAKANGLAIVCRSLLNSNEFAFLP